MFTDLSQYEQRLRVRPRPQRAVGAGPPTLDPGDMDNDKDLDKKLPENYWRERWWRERIHRFFRRIFPL